MTGKVHERAVRQDADVHLVMHIARDLANQVGLNTIQTAKVEIIVAELARNQLVHAEEGRIIFEVLEGGLQIIAQDDGPGIEDIERAMQDGYSTSGGLGSGLSAARRLADEFEIESEWGKGTWIKVVKWAV